jgi:hypothetical protein
MSTAVIDQEPKELSANLMSEKVQTSTSTPAGPKPVFRDPRGLGRAATLAWLVAALVLAAGIFTESALVAEAGRWGHLVSLALTAMWTYRVCNNLPSLGVSNPKYSAAWMAGCYFLPLVTFFVPLLGIREAQRHTGAPGRAIIPWWIVLAATNFSGLAASEFARPFVADAVRAGGMLLVAALFLATSSHLSRLQAAAAAAR